MRSHPRQRSRDCETDLLFSRLRQEHAMLGDVSAQNCVEFGSTSRWRRYQLQLVEEPRVVEILTTINNGTG